MITARWMVAIAAAAVLSAQPAAAQKVRLFFTSLSPPASPNSLYFDDWAKRVNDASNGTLDIEVKDGVTLANFGNVYERVLDDVVQIGWGQQAFIHGQFPLSEVVGLPFLVDGDVPGDIAFWRLYKTGLLDAEYKQIVPLWFGLLGASGLHFTKAPQSLEDLRGLKIRVNGKVPSDIVTALGGTPISVSADDMYEALQRGTIDGVDTSWAAFEPYRLYEVSFYHVQAPLGTAPSMFFMSRAKFDALPDAAKAALMANAGEAQSAAFGRHTEQQANEMKEKTASGPHQQIVTPSPEILALWHGKTEPVIAGWEKDHPDGDKIVATFRKIYAEVKAEH